jgi:hypothetical protein
MASPLYECVRTNLRLAEVLLYRTVPVRAVRFYIAWGCFSKIWPRHAGIDERCADLRASRRFRQAGLTDPGHALNAADRGDIVDEIEVAVERPLTAAGDPARPSVQPSAGTLRLEPIGGRTKSRPP